MMFGDQCKVVLGRGHMLGTYLKDGSDKRRACVRAEVEWTRIEAAANTIAAAAVLKGMQKHQETSTPSNVRCGLLHPAH